MADVVSPELAAKLNENATVPMKDTDALPRSTRRERSMAKINAAILAAQERQTAETPDAQKLTTPGSTLPINEEKKTAPPPKLTKEQEAVLKAQEKLLGEQEAKRLREEQEKQAAKSQFVKGAERTYKNAGNIVHGADVRIGSVPQPGGLAFPLILLLLFFFILIQVNGYSRLGHLWRVITGAERVGSVDLTQSGPGPGSTDTGTPVSPDGPPENQGQGGQSNDILANYVYIPQLPANGVFALGEY